MNNFWKSVIKFLFSKTNLDEKVAQTLENVKKEASELDEKFDNFKSDVDKAEDLPVPPKKTRKKKTNN